MVVDMITQNKTLNAQLADSLKQAGYDISRLENKRKLLLTVEHRQ